MSVLNISETIRPVPNKIYLKHQFGSGGGGVVVEDALGFRHIGLEWIGF